MNNPDIELIKRTFLYNPETGNFEKLGKAGCIKLCHDGYVRLRISKIDVSAHRAAWAIAYGEWPSMQIDHINCDRSDNRICNIRHVSPSDNQQNMQKPKITNKSGVLGASPYKGKWRASIRIGGVAKTIGVFDTPDEAGKAYLLHKIQHHKSFASAINTGNQEPTP